MDIIKKRLHGTNKKQNTLYLILKRQHNVFILQ